MTQKNNNFTYKYVYKEETDSIEESRQKNRGHINVSRMCYPYLLRTDLIGQPPSFLVFYTRWRTNLAIRVTNMIDIIVLSINITNNSHSLTGILVPTIRAPTSLM